MLIYIFLISLILILGLILKPNRNNKIKKIYICIIFGALIIVGAIRDYTIGTDTAQYVSSFKIIKDIDFSEHNSLRFEIGFFAICKILNYITENPQILIACTSFLIYGAMGIFVYRNSKDVVMSSILLITLNFYGLYMSAMRQALAIAVIIFSYRYLQERKYFKYIIGIIIASLFHQTALIMIGLIPFMNIKFKKNYLYVTIFIAIISFMSANVIFNLITKIFTIYDYYSKSAFFESNYFAALINALVSFVILIVGIYCNVLSEKEIKQENNLMAFIMSISFILYVITMKISIFSRATVYFSFYAIIWIPNSIKQVKDPKQRILINYCVLICTILYWIIIAKYRPEWHGVIPYKAFF